MSLNPFSLFLEPLPSAAPNIASTSPDPIEFPSKSILGTDTIIITSTLAPPAPSGNTSTNASSSASPSGNATSSTTTSNLPTAPTDVAGGGINGAAPVPGATGANGAYGPPDGYTAGATALKINTLLVGLGGFAIGGALIIL
ncbi:hypothetical protein AX17_000524 [Amanita inopinata Kibby_2008]|nr:hypothetical protein AX17_000524 [Amanita inopinata Kibby_2008]